MQKLRISLCSLVLGLCLIFVGHASAEELTVSPGDHIEFSTDNGVETYRAISRLGEGMFGVVWMATPIATPEARVAIKFFTDMRADPKTAIDLLQPIYQRQPTNSGVLYYSPVRPAVINDHAGHTTHAHVSVNQLAYSETLFDLLSDLRVLDISGINDLDQRLNLSFTIMTSMLRGLQSTSRVGMVLGDIKPKNVLFVRLRDTPFNKSLVANGIIKTVLADPDFARRTGEVPPQVMGTPSYMAPEYYYKNAQRLPVGDLYSIGATAYQMLFGYTPIDRYLRARSLNHSPANLNYLYRNPDEYKFFLKLVRQDLDWVWDVLRAKGINREKYGVIRDLIYGSLQFTPEVRVYFFKHKVRDLLQISPGGTRIYIDPSLTQLMNQASQCLQLRSEHAVDRAG